MSDDHMAPTQQVCWVETVDQTGLVLARYDPSQPVESADVLVLESAKGSRSAARFIGSASAHDAESETLLTVVETCFVAAVGEPLEKMLHAEVKNIPTSIEGRREWGAVGLPAGWKTPVRRMPEDDSNAAERDLATAVQSRGYQRYRSEQRLNLAPGDIVHVSGEPAMILAIDRRKGIVELQLDENDLRSVAFSDLDPPEDEA